MSEDDGADALELMERDHRDIVAMFESYAQLVATQASPEARQALAEEICMAITIHMRLENEMLYPLARQGLSVATGLNGAEADHGVTREQVAAVLGMKPEHSGYDSGVLALGQSVGRHMAEERQHLFPAVRVSGVDLRHLAGRVRERRAELQTVSEALREWAILPAYA